MHLIKCHTNAAKNVSNVWYFMPEVGGVFFFASVVLVSHCRGDSRKMHFHNVTGHYKCFKLRWLGSWIVCLYENNLQYPNKIFLQKFKFYSSYLITCETYLITDNIWWQCLKQRILRIALSINDFQFPWWLTAFQIWSQFWCISIWHFSIHPSGCKPVLDFGNFGNSSICNQFRFLLTL